MRGQQAGTEQGEAVLAQAVAAYQAALGSRLIAGYALGSLAHGGFSALVSDVDLGLILHDPPRMKDRLTIRAVARAVRADGSAPGSLRQRLSVFWGTPATLQGRASGGRFPPLDRLDLLEYGRLLAGRDAREGVPRPGPDELLVAGAEFGIRTLGGAGNLSDRLRGWVRPGCPGAAGYPRAAGYPGAVGGPGPDHLGDAGRVRRAGCHRDRRPTGRPQVHRVPAPRFSRAAPPCRAAGRGGEGRGRRRSRRRLRYIR